MPGGASEAGWVIKAQVLQGHRGQRGGIRLARDRSEISTVVASIAQLEFGDERVRSVYVEERIEKELELYVAAFVDRDRGSVRIVASLEGGVDIESVAADRIASVLIDRLVGLRPYQAHLLAAKLGLEDRIRKAFGDLIHHLYEALLVEDAELIEINPLILTPDGAFVAADAKVVLDDDAMSRHRERESPSEWQTDSEFMRRMRELGAIGVEVHRPRGAAYQGEGIAMLCNGAGMTMATFDLLTHLGGVIRGAVEMHGALAAGKEHTAAVVRGLQLVSPAVILINGFYQLRPCDTFAEAIVDAVQRPKAWIEPARVIVRMRGLKSREAIKILSLAGCRATDSLTEACSLAVEAARTAPIGSSV